MLCCWQTTIKVSCEKTKTSQNKPPLLWVFAECRLCKPAWRTVLAARNGRHLQHSRGTDSVLAPFTSTLSVICLRTNIFLLKCLVKVVTIEICSQCGKDYTLKWAEHGCSILRNCLCMKLWENVPHSWLNLSYDWSFYWHSLSSDTSLSFHIGHSLDQLIDFSSVFG